MATVRLEIDGLPDQQAADLARWMAFNIDMEKVKPATAVTTRVIPDWEIQQERALLSAFASLFDNEDET